MKQHELEAKIRFHRNAYYNGKPSITDAAFDALEDKLRVIAPDSVVLTETGAPPSGKWDKFNHDVEMQSLNKANDADDLEEWSEKVKQRMPNRDRNEAERLSMWTWSEKLDGISVAMYYENGYLVTAATRGDGKVGEDITRNVNIMQGVTHYVESPVSTTDNRVGFTGVVRGEIVLTHDKFDEHFSEYSNARNAASGIAKSMSEWQRCKHLTVYAYEVYSEGFFETDYEMFKWLEREGFMTPHYGCGALLSVVEDIYDEYKESTRDNLNYDIDGLVVKLSHRPTHAGLGERNHRPFGSVALKFPNEATVTTLRDITWQVGRTRRITPVGHFDEIELVGAEVSKASLYNCSYIEDIGPLHEGDTVVVSRANDVIPRIEEKLEQGGGDKFQYPLTCPKCGTDTYFDGEYLMCENFNCSAVLPMQIEHWLDCIGVLGWGSFLCEAVVDQGVESIPEIYELNPSDLVDLENANGARVGGSKARSVIFELHDNTDVSLPQFIKGLGITNIGERFTVRAMEDGLDTLEKLREASEERLKGVHKVGPKKAKAFYSGIRERSELVDELLRCVTIEDKSGGLDGLSFCATGSLSKARKKIYAEIKEAGGSTKSSVSKSLDYLICNNKESSSSKAKKARKYDIPLITENELREMM